MPRMLRRGDSAGLPPEVTIPPSGVGEPRVAHASSQLKAMLWKNVLLKRRALKTTLAEFLSPPAFLGILVLGYTLSSVTYIDAKQYANSTLDIATITGTFSSDSDSNVDLMGARGSITSVINGPLPVPSIDIFLAVGLAAREFLGEENLKQLNEFDTYLQLFGNILTPGTLHLSPNTAAVRDFVNASRRRHALLDRIDMVVHNSEDDAIEAIQERQVYERTWGLLAFEELSPMGVDFSIRLNYSTVPNTNWLVRWIARGLDTKYQRYLTSGFLTLQSLVDEHAFELAADAGAAASFTPPTAYSVLTPMPTDKYSQNLFYAAVSYMLSLVLVMSQLYPVALLTKSVVVEKELRLKQTMRIMGLKDRVLYASWWLSALVQFAFICLASAVVTKMFVVNTALWILLVYIGCFCLGAISFAFLLSVFFSNAILSAVVGPIAFFAALLPRYLFFGTNRFEKVDQKIYASLLLPTAFAFGADILAEYELAEIGVTTDNWGDSDYSFLTSMQMMVFDCLLYSVLGLSLERVPPRTSPASPPHLGGISPASRLDLGRCSASTSSACSPRATASVSRSSSSPCPRGGPAPRPCARRRAPR